MEGAFEGVRVAHSRKPTVWFDLFDTGQMDHVCERVCTAILDVAQGAQHDMHIPLRRWLSGPLDAYLRDHWRRGVNNDHVLAAQRFHEVIERLADRFADRWPFDADEAQREADSLRFAWLEFIAYGAAHHVYHDGPRRQKHAAGAATAPRKPETRALTPAIAAARVKAAEDVQRSAVVLEIAVEFEVSEATVWRRIDAAKKLGLLS